MPEALPNDQLASQPSPAGRVAMEAELQARLESRIRAALPLLPAQIKLERYLNLRLGHHAILIDGVEPDKELVRGRFDLLVLHQDRPLLLVELKAPDVPVTEDDVGQALSYARLHVPLVPLVLVTNGSQTILKQTYNGEDLAVADVAAERLAATLNAAAVVAAAKVEDAVRTLLGNSSASWNAILGNWNREVRAGLTGAVADFRAPIAQEFTVPRAVVGVVEQRLAAGSRVVVMHGPSLSGVTNALAQLSSRASLGPVLFVNRDAADVLLHIANKLSRELSFPISKEHVRSWLNTGRGLAQITVVMDGLPLALDELVDFATAGLLRLVIGLGTDEYRRHASVNGRMQRTSLGRNAVEVELRPLSDDEFAAADQVLDEHFSAGFSNGAQHIPSLRWPRTLRVLAATLVKSAPPDAGAGAVAARQRLRPFVGPELLVACSQAFVPDASLRFDWKKVAEAYLADLRSNGSKAGWLAATWGRPSIDPDLLDRALGSVRHERLRQQGFLSWIDSSIGPRVMIRLEELLAHFVAEEWAGAIAHCRKKGRLVAKLKEFLGYAAVMPLGDVALAAAIIRGSRENEQVFGVALPLLVDREPSTSVIKAGAVIQPLFVDVQVRLHFKDDTAEELVGDLHPWLVASQLASLPMKVAGYKRTANYSIFVQLGNSRHLLYGPAPADLGSTPGFHFHDIPGLGSFPCLSTGIIEPLTQAMLEHAWSFPDEFVDLARYAAKEKKSHLAWRVLAVAQILKDATKQTVADAGVAAEKAVKDWWDAAILNALKC